LAELLAALRGRGAPHRWHCHFRAKLSSHQQPKQAQADAAPAPSPGTAPSKRQAKHLRRCPEFCCMQPAQLHTGGIRFAATAAKKQRANLTASIETVRT
jgi:hypothetical protein